MLCIRIRDVVGFCPHQMLGMQSASPHVELLCFALSLKLFLSIQFASNCRPPSHKFRGHCSLTGIFSRFYALNNFNRCPDPLVALVSFGYSLDCFFKRLFSSSWGRFFFFSPRPLLFKTLPFSESKKSAKNSPVSPGGFWTIFPPPPPYQLPRVGIRWLAIVVLIIVQ